jgi:hypothetical protein
MTSAQWLLMAVILLGAGVTLAGATAHRRAGRPGAAQWAAVAVLGAVGTVIALVLLISGAVAG